MTLYNTRTTCRLCEGPLKDVISLGDIYLSTFLDVADNDAAKAPIDLVECELCHLFQLRHTVNPDVMYDDYWYQSGLNQSMVQALQDVVKKVDERVTLLPDDIIIDIGANDGTLLKFYPEDVITVAVEPNKLIQHAEADYLVNDFFTDEAVRDVLGDKKAKVITAIAMFYDLEDPHTFVADLKKRLDTRGIIVIQMMDMMSMIKYNDFPNLCHEHLEYYSLNVLWNLLLEHGLEIFDLEYNGVNGGSLRVYVRHSGKDAPQKVVADALHNELVFFEALGDVGAYFREQSEDAKEKVVSFIRHVNRNGKKVAVLGASTKGNTTLQFFGLTNADIDHAAEINPDKFGRRTPGSNIVIIPQEISLTMNIDYYLVLPWGFIDFFVKKLDTYIQAGGQFIVPLPRPYVINKDGKWNL